jgi:hypothetical protein
VTGRLNDGGAEEKCGRWSGVRRILAASICLLVPINNVFSALVLSCRFPKQRYDVFPSRSLLVEALSCYKIARI